MKALQRAGVRGAALAAACLSPAAYVAALWLSEDPAQQGAFRAQIFASLALSLLGYAGTVALVPEFTRFLEKRGLFGKDLCKRGIAGGDIPM